VRAAQIDSGKSRKLVSKQDTGGTLMELTEAKQLLMLALPRGLEPLFSP